MPNSTELYKTLKRKQAVNAPVNIRDLAVRIDNEEDALFDYILKNDPEQVNKLLHESDAPFFIGQNASFIPSPQRMLGELKQLQIKKDFPTLNKIISGFRIYMKPDKNKWTASPDFIRAMESLSMIELDKKGEYRFKLKIA